MGKINRRDFLRSSAAGLGSFFVFPAADQRTEDQKGDKRKSPRKFTYRTLGKTGIKLPVITMGATKVYLPRDESTGFYKESATQDFFLSRLDISLKRLGLDHVDILYHHNVWKKESALSEPVLKAMEKAKKEGKARFLGITTHRNEPEVIHAAVGSKFYEVVLTSYNFRQKHQAEMKQAISRAAQAGLGIVGMKAIGGTHLVSKSKEKIDARAALKWVLQDPNVHTIIAGFTTFDELELDLSIMEAPALTPAEKSHLLKMQVSASLYCQGCGECLRFCPQNLPIPDLMRAYMYVYGYRNLGEAQDLLLSLKLPSQVCRDCEPCLVKCVSGFNVPARIRDVVRLGDVPPEFLA
jgi:predicted aldo/keto reductase-like oxidoreductase